MKYVYLTVITLICLETNAMEPLEERSAIKRTKTWEDLKDFTEPLLSELDKCKLTESDYDFVYSELPERVAQNTADGTQVLHRINPQSTIPTLELPTPTGTIHIRASTTSVLDLPEAQKNPLQFIKDNPRTAVIKGKVTLAHQAYFTTQYLEIYTDFEISSIDLDRENILLTISGLHNNKHKMLIYRLTHDFKLERITNPETKNNPLLQTLKRLLFCFRGSTK